MNFTYTLQAHERCIIWVYRGEAKDKTYVSAAEISVKFSQSRFLLYV